MAGAMGAGGELESVRVTRILRDDIVLGRRLPGSRLVERDIAAELNVSRLPVREAIRTLVSEGVVIARPRTWAVVREFTHRDIQDFAEVREAIETLIFVFAAERYDEHGLARLRGAYERELAAALTDDAEAARVAAAEFHEIAVDLAANEMLGELIAVFLTRLRWLSSVSTTICSRWRRSIGSSSRPWGSATPMRCAGSSRRTSPVDRRPPREDSPTAATSWPERVEPRRTHSGTTETHPVVYWCDRSRSGTVALSWGARCGILLSRSVAFCSSVDSCSSRSPIRSE